MDSTTAMVGDTIAKCPMLSELSRARTVEEMVYALHENCEALDPKWKDEKEHVLDLPRVVNAEDNVSIVNRGREVYYLIYLDIHMNRWSRRARVIFTVKCGAIVATRVMADESPSKCQIIAQRAICKIMEHMHTRKPIFNRGNRHENLWQAKLKYDRLFAAKLSVYNKATGIVPHAVILKELKLNSAQCSRAFELVSPDIGRVNLNVIEGRTRTLCYQQMDVPATCSIVDGSFSIINEDQYDDFIRQSSEEFIAASTARLESELLDPYFLKDIGVDE